MDYVARYATTRAKLSTYLARKLRERGWDGPGAPPDPAEIAQRMADARYVDDEAFALARAASLGRRGYGRGRVAQALAAAGIGEDDRSPALAASAADAWNAALAFARRRRIGPYAQTRAEGDAARRAMAAMLRAGHDYPVARTIVSASPGDFLDRPED